MKNKVFLFAGIALFIITAALLTLILLLYNGVILFNNPSEKDYPVRGVDVSAYQGDIDWEILSSQNIDFAFIKATEGSSFVDKKFAYNFAEAQKTDLSIGAYHFFSFDSQGKTQAENFIKNVIPFDGMLPPVIDFEFYGDKADNPPEKDKVHAELKAFISEIESCYGLSPIIYATEETYELYLKTDFSQYDIWIRDVITKPNFSQWTFWQYTNREKLDGYKGPEKYIDMNVFNGTKEQFIEYSRYNSSEKNTLK